MGCLFAFLTFRGVALPALILEDRRRGGGIVNGVDLTGLNIGSQDCKL